MGVALGGVVRIPLMIGLVLRTTFLHVDFEKPRFSNKKIIEGFVEEKLGLKKNGDHEVACMTLRRSYQSHEAMTTPAGKKTTPAMYTCCRKQIYMYVINRMIFFWYFYVNHKPRKSTKKMGIYCTCIFSNP